MMEVRGIFFLFSSRRKFIRKVCQRRAANECLVDTRFSSFRTIETTIETRYRGQFF